MTTDAAVRPPSMSFRLTTLGSAALVRSGPDGAPTTALGPGKPFALLAYLALSPLRQASRDHLVDLLWSDVSPRAGDQSLRQAISSLRKLLGDEAFTAADGTVTLNVPMACDSTDFLQAVEDGDLAVAVALYRGDFLPLLAVPGGALFEQWSESERSRLKLMFMRTGERLAKQWLSAGRARDAQRLARRIRDANPDDERSWRVLLEALISGQDATGALVEADALERMLRADEREPEPATASLLNLARHTTQQEETRAEARMTAELIGREREFATIIESWEEARRGAGRHIHLAAPAGIGKTRLLTDACARLRATGARLINLRANSGERRIAGALAAELAARICELPGATGVSPATARLLVGLNPTISSRLKVAADMGGTREELSRRRSAAIAEALEAVADEAPLAILVDDVHWADAESRQALHTLAAKVAATRVLLLTAARPVSDGQVSASATQVLSLDPLTPADLASLISSLGDVPPEDWARALPVSLHRATGGSPLLALETLQLLCERGTLTLAGHRWACPSPVTLLAELVGGSALENRVARLDRHETWLLLLMSIAGMPLADEVLFRASGQTPDDVRTTLAAIEHRGFIRRSSTGWEPAHDEIGAMMVDRADRAAARAAHAALGHSLALVGDADIDVLLMAGQHELQAGNEPELERIFVRCVLAARRRGDARSIPDLARQILGDHADQVLIRRLASSLPLRARWSGTGSARAIASVALVALLSMGATLLFSLPEAPLPDATFLVVERSPDGATRTRQVPVRREGWPATPDLDLLRDGRAYNDSVFDQIIKEDVAISPDGESWIVSHAVTDQGSGSDLFLHQQERVWRLTEEAGDDLHPAWSPDQRQIVFRTTRWHPRAWADLAIMDLHTGRTRQLTSGDHVDAEPKWSPDGTRIAFRRVGPRQGAPGHLCWVQPNGTGLRCISDPPGMVYQSLLGWQGTRNVLIQVSVNQGEVGLARVDADDGDVRILVQDSLFDPILSQDGRWIACQCQSPGESSSEWRIFPVDNPDRIARLPLEHKGVHRRRVRWLSSSRAPAPIERITIREPVAALPSGISHVLVADAFDSSSRRVAGGPITWASSDTSIAVINDSTGVLLPRRPGRVMIRASAGGWRSDWAPIVVEEPASKLVLTEDWGRPLDSAWIPFGEPRPSLTTGPGGRFGMLNGGDGTYESGVYSKRAVNGARGVGLEAWVSTPGDSMQYQQLIMALDPTLDSAALATWDHRNGYPSRGGGTATMCVVTYPVGDGPPSERSFFIAGRRLRATPPMRSGAWYRIRLQVFPDGSCGTAINGRPIAREHHSHGTGLEYRALLQGSSVGTRVLVGPLEVWEGVRTDIDWSVLR